MDKPAMDPALASAFDELGSRPAEALPSDPELSVHIVDLHRRRQNHRRVGLAAAGLGLAAGFAAVLMTKPSAEALHPATLVAIDDAGGERSSPVVGPPAPRSLPPSGRFFADARRIDESEAIPVGVWLHTPDEVACTELPGQTRLCLDAGAKARLIEASGSDLAHELVGSRLLVELSQGRLTVANPAAVPGSETAAAESIVLTSAGDVQGSDGEFSVELTAEILRVQVKVGGVHITRAQGEQVRLRSGERIDLVAARAESRKPDPKRSAPLTDSDASADASAGAGRDRPSSAVELGREAASQLGRRDYAAAADTYEQLAERHPQSAAGRQALVALGQLRLDRFGRPRTALAAFERYLEQPGGAVAQEAAYGRIRCLIALRRRPETSRAIAEFLERYPGSPYASELSARASDPGGDRERGGSRP